MMGGSAVCRFTAGLLAASAATGVTAPPAAAQTLAAIDFDQPAQDLPAALRAVALSSGTSIIAPAELVGDRQAPALEGRFSVDQAVAQLLAGTGLEAVRSGNGLIIRQAATAAEREPPEGVVVTGTRIRGAAPAGANVITLDRRDIERSGYATTQQVLQSLPQNFGGGPNEGTVGFSVRNGANTNIGSGASVNLRGLGTTSTLVLIDGNRPALGGGSGTFVDLSLIPSTAIDRIEVLADGASALYGSDAVAGVVNVRLRNDFIGAESRLRYGAADGFDEVQASQLAGFGWKTGHLAAGYEFYRRGRLAAADRSYVTEDLRPFGGPDYRKTFANPGTIITADGRTFAIPAGQDGTALTAADLAPDDVNRSDGRAASDVLPQLERHAAYLAVGQDFGSSLRFRMQGFFGDRRSLTRTLPDNYGGVVVPVNNPFYVDPTGTGQPVTVNYDFTADLGPETSVAHVRNWGVTAGLEKVIGRWSAAVTGSWGLQTQRQRTINIPNYFNLSAALADPDPDTAYNLFSDGSHTRQDTIEAVRGFYEQTGTSRIWNAGVRLDGPLFGLPAGDLRLAVGSEYRREHYAYTQTDYEFSADPVDAGTSGFPIGRSIIAGYAEMLVPLAGRGQRVPAVDRLDLSLAGRIERYSDFGTTINPKAGVSWRPTDGLTVRGTWGTSFRAPGFIDVRTGPGTSLYIPVRVPDPASPGGVTSALALFGGSPGVGPEKATTWTAGADIRPAALPGLHASLTWFDIAYRDRITSLGADYLSFLAARQQYQGVITDNPAPEVVAAYYADRNFANPSGIAAADIRAILDGRTLNLASVGQQGLDFDAGYDLRRGPAAFGAGISGSYLFNIRQRVTSDAPATDVVSTIGNPVNLRLRGRLTAAYGQFSLAGFVNHLAGYANDAVLPAETVSSWTTVDLSLGWDATQPHGPLRGLRLSLSITNLFDRDPPYVNNPTAFSAAGFDPENASPVGRLVALQVTKTW